MQNLIEVLKIATGTFFGLLAFAGVLHSFIQVKVYRARQEAEIAAHEAAEEIDSLLTRYEEAIKQDRALREQEKVEAPAAKAGDKVEEASK